MSAQIAIKCAELFWKPESSHLEYRCVVCFKRFYSQSDFFQHIHGCLQVEIVFEGDYGDCNRIVMKKEPIIIDKHRRSHSPSTSGKYKLKTILNLYSICFFLFQENWNSPDIKEEIIEYIDEEHLIENLLSDDEETQQNENIEHPSPNATSIKRLRKPYTKRRPTKDLSFTRLLLNNIFQNQSDNNMSCDICDYRHHARSRILNHMERNHMGDKPKAKKYCCEICGIKMSEMGNLNVHKRIHTGERPFPCTIESCNRSFISTSDRTIHMRMHLGEKPYKCDECPNAYRSKNILSMHKRSRHSDVRPYTCAECGRSFKISKTYKDHLLTHSGQRPFTCEVCGSSFRKRSTYNAHANIHTDKRPYACNHCERAFHSSAARRSHEKTFHKLP